MQPTQKRSGARCATAGLAAANARKRNNTADRVPDSQIEQIVDQMGTEQEFRRQVTHGAGLALFIGPCRFYPALK